ncbi:MAG TPA: ABC transporter substrate-binding protein [Chloroflexota bacterium]|nr:ABC transporter substrate-binding protein [Chloroflexota bacterium]
MTELDENPAGYQGQDEAATADDRSLVSRKRFLATGLAAAGGLALAARDPISAARAAEALAPKKRGGTLVVGSIGSTTDSLDPNLTQSNMDLQRLFNLYDTLTYFPHNALDLKYGLAESIEMTHGSTVATVRLRKGVEFHNGKTLSAEDLIYTWHHILEKSDPHASLLSMVDPTRLKKLDNRTVRAHLKHADSVFPERFYVDQMVIIPKGFDPKHPVGTGPFKFKSFEPGKRSVFVRNPNYWIHGQPYIDELVIIDMADPTAQINALLSGQVDAIDSVPLNETQVIKSRSNLRLLTAHGGYFQPIVMRVDKPPFNDVRVRQAFRLIVDRPQMITQAYDGYAVIGNDMPSPSDPAYPHLPQRRQDIAQAKSLLKAAGHSNLSVQLSTANEDFGLIPGAEVFVQNAKAAGVNVTLNQLQPSVFDAKFTVWPFTQGYWGNKPFGIMYSLLYFPGGIFNETHFNDPQGNKIFTEALKDSNPATRNAKFKELEKILYERGGHIIHSFRTTVDAYNTKFKGFSADKATGWSLGQYRYREVSLR